MNKKGKFIAVVNIRSFEIMDNGQKATRWAVKYLCEYNYPHKDGTIGKQQILAEYLSPPKLVGKDKKGSDK